MGRIRKQKLAKKSHRGGALEERKLTQKEIENEQLEQDIQDEIEREKFLNRYNRDEELRIQDKLNERLKREGRERENEKFKKQERIVYDIIDYLVHSGEDPLKITPEEIKMIIREKKQVGELKGIKIDKSIIKNVLKKYNEREVVVVDRINKSYNTASKRKVLRAERSEPLVASVHKPSKKILRAEAKKVANDILKSVINKATRVRVHSMPSL